MSVFDSTFALEKGVSTFYAVSTAVLFVLGVLVQFLSLKVLLHQEHKSRELSPYLVNICLANILCLLLQFPLVFVASFQKGWASLGRSSCYVAGITCVSCSTVMVVTLASVSVKIYHSISDQDTSLQERSHMSNRKKFAIIWIFSVLIFIPTTLGWNSIVPDGPHCTVNWQAESILDASYLVVLAFISFIIPLVVSCLYSIKTSRYVSRHSHHEAAFTVQQIRSRALHIGAGKLTAVVVLIFFILWLPYWIDGFTTLFAVKTTKQVELAVLPWLFLSISMVYCPLVYIAMNKRFRRSLLKLLGCKRSQRRVNPRISVDRFESSDALSSCHMAMPAYSPSILVPRSPLVNRSFKLSLFEDVASEIIKQRKPLQSGPELTNEAVTRLIRSSLHAAHELHEEYSTHGGRERRNTTVI